MYQKDLSHIDRKPCLRNVHLQSLAVGWLSNEHHYLRGKTDDQFINRLWEFCRFGTVAQTLGYHECEFCVDQEFGCIERYQDIELILGSSEICVLDYAGRKAYFAPDMIFHYVTQHGYIPPIEFM